MTNEQIRESLEHDIRFINEEIEGLKASIGSLQGIRYDIQQALALLKEQPEYKDAFYKACELLLSEEGKKLFLDEYEKWKEQPCQEKKGGE